MVTTTAEAVKKSPGDPNLIAKAIIKAVRSTDMPNHLPLGDFAYHGALKNFQNRINELKSNKDISLSTDD